MREIFKNFILSSHLFTTKHFICKMEIPPNAYPNVCPNHHYRYDHVAQHKTARKPDLIQEFEIDLAEKYGHAVVAPDQHGDEQPTSVDIVAGDENVMGIIWSKMDKPTRANSVFACKKWAMELINQYYRPNFDCRFSERVRTVNFRYYEILEYKETNGTYTRIKYKCVCDLWKEASNLFYPRETLLNVPSDIDFNNFDQSGNNANYNWRIQCGAM